MMTINDVEMCFKATVLKKATPHREPDFKKLNEEFGPDTEVKGIQWFIEEHNTGYGGVLERWEFRGEKDNLRFSFWADLLPGLILSSPKPVTP